MQHTFVIGGGAAGFFSAIIAATKYPELQITILEQQKKCLSKVRISGGGRCNVTTGIEDSKRLLAYYPRGSAFLAQPFTKFGPKETKRWFEQRGVKLKTESDGRVFPVTDQSQTIINCLLDECQRLGIKIVKQKKVVDVQIDQPHFRIVSRDGDYRADSLIVATGSSSVIWKVLQKLNHNIVPAVPSLFTFTIRHPLVSGLQGLSITDVKISIDQTDFEALGSLLITHWGLSGPAVLKLSAFAARILHSKKYHFEIIIDFLPEWDYEQWISWIEQQGKRKPVNASIPFPKRLWLRILEMIDFPNRFWAEIGKKDRLTLWQTLKKCKLPVTGKSTFKEEFVTAGGVNLTEVDPETCESKLVPNLFLCGEVLDIDAVTGGFNFQAAWTTAWMVGNGINRKTPSTFARSY